MTKARVLLKAFSFFRTHTPEKKFGFTTESLEALTLDLNDKLQSIETVSLDWQGRLHVTFTFFNKHLQSATQNVSCKEAKSRQWSFDPAALLETIMSAGHHLNCCHSIWTLQVVMGLKKRDTSTLDLCLTSCPSSSLTPFADEYCEKPRQLLLQPLYFPHWHKKAI